MRLDCATNQSLVAAPGTTSEITTDPVRLDGKDRASAIPLVHSLVGPGTPEFSYFTQVSNDGTAWVDQGPSDILAGAGAGPIEVGPLNGAYFRVVFRLEADAGSTPSSVVFDLSLNVWKTSAPCAGCDAAAPCANCSVAPADAGVMVTPQPFSGTQPMAAAGGSGAAGTFAPETLVPDPSIDPGFGRFPDAAEPPVVPTVPAGHVEGGTRDPDRFYEQGYNLDPAVASRLRVQTSSGAFVAATTPLDPNTGQIQRFLTPAAAAAAGAMWRGASAHVPQEASERHNGVGPLEYEHPWN